jgi:hypothetical protein
MKITQRQKKMILAGGVMLLIGFTTGYIVGAQSKMTDEPTINTSSSTASKDQTTSQKDKQSSATKSSSSKKPEQPLVVGADGQEIKDLSDREVDAILNNMTVEERAALIVIGAPKQFPVTGLKDHYVSTQDILKVGGYDLLFEPDGIHQIFVKKGTPLPDTPEDQRGRIERQGERIIYTIGSREVGNKDMRDLYRKYMAHSRYADVQQHITFVQ